MQPLFFHSAAGMTAVAVAAAFTAATPLEHWLERTATQDGFIYFYDAKNEKTEFLGNFHHASVEYHGLKFQCSEAAFQAAKFPHDRRLQEEFTRVDGDGAFKLAKQHANSQRGDWLQVNKQVMYEVLRAKFTQHPHLLRQLLATRNAYLVEHTPPNRDGFWGDNGDGTGQNELGKLLMKIRGEFGGTGIVPAPAGYYRFVQSSTAQASAKRCALPGCIRPGFVDSRKVHPFCGKSHAAEFLRKYKKIKCDLPGCDNPPYIEASGRVHDFCCKTHANLYWKQN